MTTLVEGGEVFVQGSGKNPYVLKNTGGVLSCSCPAWRNQSLPIDKRTCKHLIALLGTDAEAQRTGNTSLGSHRSAGNSTLRDTVSNKDWAMLAESWAGEDVTGWYCSEKLDGVRALWTGKEFISRQGNKFFAPAWFTKDFQSARLDGELWMGRGKFQQTVSVARSQNGDWTNMFFMVFDYAVEKMKWEDRLKALELGVQVAKLKPHGNVERLAEKAFVLPQKQVVDMHTFALEMDAVINKGGEGLMLKKPGSLYVPRRSPALLKVKRFQTAEATIINMEVGKGRHVGTMGALVCVNNSGVQFKVGSGFSDSQRRTLWNRWIHNADDLVGTIIEYQFQELTDGGNPRFPTFVRMRSDL